MSFSSLIFIFGFLPLFLGTYFLVGPAWRNGVAIIFSVFFYTWGEPLFSGVLLGASFVVFLFGSCLAPGAQTSERKRKWTLWLGLAFSLSLLVVFKYANFGVHVLDLALSALHREKVSWSNIALPIGISFFTFQKISYLIDVYRGTAKPAEKFSDFLLYVFLFPQLIAGPIVRYHDVSAQLSRREETLERFQGGLLRFSRGLAAKVLVANPLGHTADRIFGLAPEQLSTPYAWLGMIAYSLQIYFDFSGYSDMAIGIARVIGFNFPENFDRPYQARSVSGFWRRWHISLGSFMQEYLYRPLGGNRSGSFRTFFNLWVVFLISGFWHGANWTFIAWGAYHGTLLSIERLIGRERIERVPGALSVPITFLAVSLGWILFRSDSLHQAWNFATHLLPYHAGAESMESLVSEILPRRTATVLFLAFGLAMFASQKFCERVETAAGDSWRWIRAAGGIAGFVLTAAALASQNYNPFIYFRF